MEPQGNNYHSDYREARQEALAKLAEAERNDDMAERTHQLVKLGEMERNHRDRETRAELDRLTGSDREVIGYNTYR